MDCFKTTKKIDKIQHTKSETVIVGGTILDKVVTRALSYVHWRRPITWNVII